MTEVKFIYFEGCPNADKTRKALKAVNVDFDEVEQTSQPEGSPYKNYSSPTILKDNEIVIGSKTGDGGGCSLEVPTADDLKQKLGLSGDGITQEVAKKSGFLSAFGSFGSALTVGLCPICIPAIGAFLSSIGLGFLVSESVLLPVLLIFLTITIGGLLFSYLKEHRKIAPLVIGVLMGLSLYLGRYVYFGAVINQVLMYGGIAGIVAVSFWNLRLRKQVSCSACVVGPKVSGKGI